MIKKSRDKSAIVLLMIGKSWNDKKKLLWAYRSKKKHDASDLSVNERLRELLKKKSCYDLNNYYSIYALNS